MITLSSVLALSVSVSANSIDAAQQLLVSGDYLQARSIVSKFDTAQALILQAEIMSAQVMLGDTDSPHKLAGQAREIAGRAVALEPDNKEARIQYALAYGFEARTSGIFKAWRKKLPQKCKIAIDEAYAIAPEDPRTAALIGAWHLGLVRKAGEKRAAKMFKASEAQGIDWYDKAVAAKPDDIVILGNYAFSLLGIDSVRHEAKARSLMEASKAATPKGAVEAQVQERMDSLLAVMDDKAVLAAQIDRLMNDPDGGSQ